MALRRTGQGVLILRPKQSMLDWLASIPGGTAKLHLEKSANRAIAVLIPACESEAEILQLLDRNLDRFFEEALTAWSVDLSAWSKKRDLRSFRELFEIEMYSKLFDMGLSARETSTSGPAA